MVVSVQADDQGGVVEVSGLPVLSAGCEGFVKAAAAPHALSADAGSQREPVQVDARVVTEVLLRGHRDPAFPAGASWAEQIWVRSM
ncbi:hypothetical protein GCM10027026_03360 [Myroides odoratimimus subsp. xuanwuensis]